MTVSKKLKSTLSTLEGILADFNSSYMESQDESDKQMFKGLAKDTADILQKVTDRLSCIEEQESQ